MYHIKNFKLLITVFAYISIIACKKNNTTPTPINKPQETPLQTLVATKVLDTISIHQFPTFEFGYVFHSTQNGRITKFGCYMPSNFTYRVALWDNNSEQYIDTSLIKVTDHTKFTYVNIKPIPIMANKKYTISINNAFNRETKEVFTIGQKSKFGDINFPLSSKSIIVEATKYKQNGVLTFPDYNLNASENLYGIPDFVFEAE